VGGGERGARGGGCAYTIGMTPRFQIVDRETPYLFPPSVQDWLPANHLARFVVEVVDGLALGDLSDEYAGRGTAAYPPTVLVSLLFYGYATGVFSSRKLERATHDSVAFRFIAANTHPDHDTIATFRRRFSERLKPVFVEILTLAREMGLMKVGRVSVDGTKVLANASKHSALSWEHACRLERQLQDEVAELWRRAEQADAEAVPDGMDIPAELVRREARLAAIAAAKATLEARAAARHAAEQAEYERKLAARAEKARARGKKPTGRAPQPPTPGVRKMDQVNLTDEESRVMPVPGGGFEQAYNAQVAVDVDSLLIVAEHVSQQCNDKQELAPMVATLGQLPTAVGQVADLLADNGYYSAGNVQTCVAHGVTPYLAAGRDRHHPGLAERFAADAPTPEGDDAVTRMKHRLTTRAGQAVYGLRKSTVEPVFGIIKSALGFRQFLRRGVKAVSEEWTLISIAWNLKRLFTLSLASR
jgi:transposase